MADLLDADALDEIFVRLSFAAEVEALEEVLHHRAHIAELPAEAFLQGVGGGRVRLVGGDGVDKFLDVKEHGLLPRSMRCRSGRVPAAALVIVARLAPERSGG